MTPDEIHDNAALLEHGFDSNPPLAMLYFKTVELAHLPDELFDGRHAILLRDVHFVDSHGTCHTAHKGLITDGGSIPRFFWRVCGSPFTFCLLAYLIHDEHRAAADELVDAEIRKQARKAADMLFSEMLYWIDRYCRHISVPGWKRKAMYLAVRWHARQLNGHSQS